ncbi:MAG: hypothetical protein Q4E55_02670 [Bacteroidales bacterium]|nr:hypothetical protein [Bacteroidales bacterium]
MENKIQELANKIYHEGVEKGNAEAQNIVKAAQEEAGQIVAEAQKKADAIVAAANKKAEETASNTKAEMRMFAQQAVNALKSEITNLLVNESVTKAVAGMTADKGFLNKFMLTMAQKWSATEPVEIAAKDAEGLKAFFAQQVADLFAQNIAITQVNGKKTLFSIGPADGSYKINFGEEEFKNYFKEFLRPQLVEMLF